MNEQEKIVMEQLVPDTVKNLVANNQLHKIAEHRLGKEVTLPNVVEYLGTKLASRRQNYRTIAEGLMALHQLRG